MVYTGNLQEGRKWHVGNEGMHGLVEIFIFSKERSRYD